MIKYYYYGDPHAHIPSLATAYPGKQIGKTSRSEPQ